MSTSGDKFTILATDAGDAGTYEFTLKVFVEDPATLTEI